MSWRSMQPNSAQNAIHRKASVHLCKVLGGGAGSGGYSQLQRWPCSARHWRGHCVCPMPGLCGQPALWSCCSLFERLPTVRFRDCRNLQDLEWCKSFNRSCDCSLPPVLSGSEARPWGPSSLCLLPWSVSWRLSWHYSSHTLMGLAAFAVLANMDALFVKHFFSPSIAGDYGPVVTLAKMSLFIPLAMGIVLLPKATRRRVGGRDPRPILLLALAATLLPGFALTAVYFLYPGSLVRTIFTAAFTSPGMVLGLVNLAATFYAGLNIWLNYALSLERLSFIYILAGVLVWQGTGMYFFGRYSLVHMSLVMVSAGLVGNLAGFVTTCFTSEAPEIALS